jgi:hypothetical protein
LLHFVSFGTVSPHWGVMMFPISKGKFERQELKFQPFQIFQSCHRSSPYQQLLNLYLPASLITHWIPSSRGYLIIVILLQIYSFLIL